MRTRRVGAIGVVVLGLVGGWAAVGSAGGPSKAERCEATKLTAAALKASCLAIEEAKGILGGTPKPARCSVPFTKAFTIAEAIAGGQCPTTGDAAAIEDLVDSVSRTSRPRCRAGGPPTAARSSQRRGRRPAGTPPTRRLPSILPRVQGRGRTATSRPGQRSATPTTWTGRSPTTTPGSCGRRRATTETIHDWDNLYTWADAFAVHIAGLNAATGFAGHTTGGSPT